MRAAEGAHAGAKRERQIAETPYWEFAPEGPEKAAAKARGTISAAEGGRRAAGRARTSAAASVGRGSPDRPAGEISRFSIYEKPQTEEMAARLKAYRAREAARKKKARAGKKSVLRRPSRNKRRLLSGRAT